MSNDLDQNSPATWRPDDDVLFRALTRIGLVLDVSVQRSDVQAGSSGAAGNQTTPRPDVDPMDALVTSADHAGIYLSEMSFSSPRDAVGFLRQGYPIILAVTTAPGEGKFIVLETLSGRRVETTTVADELAIKVINRRRLGKLLNSSDPTRCFVCKKELECDLISAAAHHGDSGNDHSGHHDGDHHHDHPGPLSRWVGLLSLDRRDIWTVVLFAMVSGILMLATPLAIESLVNVVSWGTYLQPLVILGLMLLVCLGLAGVLKVLQAVVVEIIQRRQFVRIVGDLAHRFPRANQPSLTGEFPRELANRVFDVMTIQKATAVLLLDGVSIVLTTILGLILLAFYHPFLLGFDIVLVISMISITWILGRGGIVTAIDESITKYKVVHWLQDVLASPTVFKVGGGESLAVERANQLSTNYIDARQKQFRVVIRQIAFAISLQVIASTAVLALGGWLVIDGQLTLGQLVASELVVTTVVGAFAKAGKSIEKFYDLMAGVDKVGHLIDVPADPKHDLGAFPEGPAEVSWNELSFKGTTFQAKVPDANIAAGSRAAIVGDDVDGRAALVRSIVGLKKPNTGLIQIAGFDANHASCSDRGKLIGYAGKNDVFHGSLRENVDLGLSGISQDRIRNVLETVGLEEVVLKLPQGLQTKLQTGGYPLTEMQARLLALARVIIHQPRLLVIDGLLDDLPTEQRNLIWNSLDADDSWTLLVNTNHDNVAELCASQISVRRS
jgi:putative ABC transport system ATP-binding protein